MAHVWEPWLQCQSVILKYLYLAYKKHPDQHYLRMPAKKKKLNMPSGIGQNHVFLSSKPRQDGSQDANLPFSQHAGFPSESCSVMSDSLQPHWLYSPWNSPGQNTGVGESESEVTQSCPTLCDPWTVAYQASPSKGFSRQEYGSRLPFPSPGGIFLIQGLTQVSHIAGRFFTNWTMRKTCCKYF